MQRTIQDIHDHFKQFRKLRDELMRQIGAFHASFEPGVVERITSMAGSSQSSGNGPNSRTPLLAIKQTNDKERDKKHAAELAVWFTTMTAKSLQAGYESYAQFDRVTQNEDTARGNFYDLLKLYDYAIEEKIQADVNACNTVISQSIKEADQLLDEMRLLVTRKYPNLERCIENLFSLSVEVERKLSEWNDKYQALVEKNKDKQNLEQLFSNITSLKTLKAIPKTDKLYERLAALFEGTEWSVDWNRRDPFIGEVSEFIPEWQKLAPILEERKTALDACVAEYKAVNWQIPQQGCGLVQAEMEELLAYVEFATVQRSLPNLFEPLFSRTEILDPRKKRQQINRVAKVFDDVMNDLGRQSQRIAFNISSIEAQIKAIPVGPAPVALTELGEDSVIEKMKNLYQEYDWRVKFSNDTVRVESEKYGYSHSVELIHILQQMLPPKVYETLCLESTSKSDISEGSTAPERRAFIELGRTFLHQQRNLFMQELMKIQTLNSEVVALTTEMANDRSFAHLLSLFRECSELEKFASVHNQKFAEHTLSALHEQVISKAETFKETWLKQSEWEAKLEGSINESCQPAIPRLVTLRKSVESIRDTLKQLNDCPVAATSPSPQYNNIVEKYNELIVVIRQIQSAADQMLADDAAQLNVYMNEFEEEMQTRMSEARKLIREGVQRSCNAMNTSINEIKTWYPRLETAMHEMPTFSEVLPTLQLFKWKFKQLKDSHKDCFNLIKNQYHDTKAPLEIIPVSFSDMEIHWVNGALNYFERSYQDFLFEESERQLYVKEGLAWSEMLKPNYLLLTTATTLWQSVGESESKVKQADSEHTKMSATLRKKLNMLKLKLIDKAASNQRIQTIVENLKKTVLEQLAELNQENPYSVAMVRHVLHELLRENADCWQLLNKEKGPIEESVIKSKRIEKSKINSDVFFSLVQAFSRLATNGTAADLVIASYQAAYGVTDAFTKNLFTAAVIEVNNFIQFKINIKTLKKTKIQNITNEIGKIRNGFYEVVRQHLIPIGDLQNKFIADENQLHDDFKITAIKHREFSERMKKLEALLADRVSEISLAPITPALDVLPKERPVITPSNAARMNDVQNREPFKSPEEEVVNLADVQFELVEFKKNITTAVNAIINASNEDEKKPQPITLFTLCKTQLTARIERVKKKTKEGGRLKALHESNANDLVLLMEEKQRLQAIQKQSQQALLKMASLLLSKKAYMNVCAAKEPIQVIALTAERLDNIIKDNASFKQEAEKLSNLKPVLLTLRGNAYITPLVNLSKITAEVLRILQASLGPLHEAWAKLKVNYDQLQFESGADNASHALERLLTAVTESFEALNDADDLSDVVTFSSNHEESCVKLTNIMTLFLKQMDFINSEPPHFLSGFGEAYAEPIQRAWEDGEVALRNSYRLEMQKVFEMYQWLFKANARLVSFKKLAELEELVSIDDIIKLGEWVEQSAQPFLNAYNKFIKGTKPIAELDEVIAKLEAEQEVLAAKLPAFEVYNDQAKTIKEHLESIEPLELAITNRVRQIDSLQLDERMFTNAKQALLNTDETMFVNVRDAVFQRFKCLFLTNKETLEILASLGLRAEKYRVEKNKVKKPDNAAAIYAFIHELSACDTNLLKLVRIIRDPIESEHPQLGDKKVTLLRERGGFTETCKLIHRLDVVLKRLLQDHKSLFLKDIEDEFVMRNALLKADNFLEPKPQGAMPSRNYRFDCFCEIFEEEIRAVDTGQKDVVNRFVPKLQIIKVSGDNELAKLGKLRELIEAENNGINQSLLKGGLKMFFGASTILGAWFQKQIERLDQILASYPKPTNGNGLGNH